MSTLSPYIAFENTLEAIEYYQEYFYAENVNRMSMTAEMGEKMGIPAVDCEGVTIHANFTIQGNLILCSDRMSSYGIEEKFEFNNGISFIIDYNSEDESDVKSMHDLYNSITSHPDTVVEMELAEQYWGGSMGRIIDKFGITWMVHSQPYSKK